MPVWFLLLQQQVASVPDPFFTNDFEGWLRLGGFALAIIGSLWWFLRDPLTQRIKNAEAKLDKNGARLDTVERDLLVAQKDIDGLTESFEVQQTQLNRFIEVTDRLRDAIFESKTEILERLAYSDGEKHGRRAGDKDKE